MRKYIEMENYFPELVNNYESKTKSGKPMAFIRVNFYDFHQNLGTLRLAVQMDKITEMAESFRIYHRNYNYYKYKFYNELVNSYFHPIYGTFSTTYVLNYVCNQPFIQDHLNLILEEDCKIIVDVHINSPGDSKIKLYTSEHKNYITVDDSAKYDLIKDKNTGVSWTFLTKLNLLEQERLLCLLRLVEQAKSSDKGLLKLNFDELAETWREYLGNYKEVNSRLVLDILGQLQSNELINLEFNRELYDHRNNKSYFLLSICDIELYDLMDKHIYKKLSA